jgi:hypothetical protein
MYTKFLSEKLKGRTLRRERHRWEDNNKKDFWEIRWKVVDWMHLDQDRDQ